MDMPFLVIKMTNGGQDKDIRQVDTIQEAEAIVNSRLKTIVDTKIREYHYENQSIIKRI